jgi:peptidoglycan/xylan/chitin deacetylase (PgdA/CDA1 family)
MPRASSLVLAALLAAFAPAHSAAQCKATAYLTLDTGSMSQAENIVRIMRKHDVRATFFLANEKTIYGDYTLEDSWGEYWRARVAEGHAFGSHTFDHGYFRGDLPDGRVKYAVRGKPVVALDAAGVCAELNRSRAAFERMTGRKYDPIWRAPGGYSTPNAVKHAQQCGYRHIGWAPAGFLGDELPSETYPNEMLLRRALNNIRDGDILMLHLGIRSRKDPFAPMLDPLIAGLKERGFCFATLGEPRK